MYENSIPRQHGLAQTKPFALNYPPQQQQLRAEQISKMLLCTRLCAEMERSAGRCVEDATAIAKAWAREEFGEGSKSEIEVRAVKHSIDAFSGKVRVEVLYVAMPGTIMLVFRSVEGETLLLLDPGACSRRPHFLPNIFPQNLRFLPSELLECRLRGSDRLSGASIRIWNGHSCCGWRAWRSAGQTPMSR
jgi:hypothetical protein